MSEALLKAEANQPQADATPQGGTADVDKQPTPEQKLYETEPEKAPEPKEPEKPAESKTEPEKKGDKETEEKREGAPELYEFDIPKGLPEDFEKDEAVFDALAKVSRELNLSQTQAQSLVDEVWPVMHRRAEEQQKAIHDSWVDELKNDKEFGGEKLSENASVVNRALEAFAGDDVKELMGGPLGRHPGLFRMLVKVGRTVSEDEFVAGRSGEKSVDLNDTSAIAKKLYGDG